jgi:hypothetical protein
MDTYGTSDGWLVVLDNNADKSMDDKDNLGNFAS